MVREENGEMNEERRLKRRLKRGLIRRYIPESTGLLEKKKRNSEITGATNLYDQFFFKLSFFDAD
jgi:hypothetical protein